MEYLKMEDNPRYVLSLKGTHGIISSVAKRPDYYKKPDFGKKAGLVDMLIHIGVLRTNEEKLWLNTPVFLKKDYKSLNSFSKAVAEKIGEILACYRQELYEFLERIASGFDRSVDFYHLVCGYIFAGRMLEYLEETSLVYWNDRHPNGLDYITLLYEKTWKLNRLCKGLYCSYNRYGNSLGTFKVLGTLAATAVISTGFGDLRRQPAI